MRKVAILVVIAVIVAGGAYYMLRSTTDERLKTALDQSLQHLPKDLTVTYRSVTSEPATESGTVTGVVIHYTGDHPGDVTIDEIDISKPTFDLGDRWNKAAADPSALLPETVLPVAGKIVLKNIKAHNDFVDYGLKSAEVDNLRLYPWALFHAGISSPSQLQEILKPHTPPSEEDLHALLRLEAAIYGGFGLDSETIEGVTVKVAMPAQGNVPAMNMNLEVASMRGTGIDRGVVDSGELDGIKADIAPQGNFSVDKATITAFNMRAALAPVLSGGALAPSLLNGITLGSIEYDGITVHPATGGPVSLDKFSLSNFAFDHDVMTTGGFSLVGLKLSKTSIPTPEAAKMFDQLGLDQMTIGAGASYSWDVASKRVTVRGATVKVDELGTLDLTAEAADAVPGPDWQNLATFAHAALHYTDASLVDRALKAASDENKTSPDALRKEIVQTVQQYGVMLGTSPAIVAALKAVTSFIAAPHNLTVELTPATPVPFATLKTATMIPPPQLVQMLGLSVTANQ